MIRPYSISLMEPFLHVLTLTHTHTHQANKVLFKMNVWVNFHGLLFHLCSANYVNLLSRPGAQLRGGGALGALAPPAFHTLAEDITRNGGATHFTLGLRPCLSHPSFYKYTCAPPPIKITQLRPCSRLLV